MKTIGLIGGMSWESTAAYYRIINETVRQRVGGLHSARCVLWSFDFDEIEGLQRRGDWAQAGRRLVDAGKALARAGADFLVLCTNTMHRAAGELESEAGLPLLHIADATAIAIKSAGLTRVGLLGTRYTMEGSFYRGRMVDRHGLDVLVPDRQERQFVDHVIFDELCVGRIEAASRERYEAIIQRLGDAGAEGIILGCTEIGLLVKTVDSPLPLFDTARIHAEAAVKLALA